MHAVLCAALKTKRNRAESEIQLVIPFFEFSPYRLIELIKVVLNLEPWYSISVIRAVTVPNNGIINLHPGRRASPWILIVRRPSCVLPYPEFVKFVLYQPADLYETPRRTPGFL
jgi:hypothetical protein